MSIRELLSVLCLPVLAITALVFLFVMAYKESKEWEQFKIDHSCKVVAKIDGEVFNTFAMDSKGNPVIGVGSTPNKTGWLCNDGVTYYK